MLESDSEVQVIMAFWWVNHKQTYRQETEGGYIWSLNTKANGANTISYDNLTRCQVGDVIFSYAFAQIAQIGLVETAAITAPKPAEFGTAGDNWNQDAWLVRVNGQPQNVFWMPAVARWESLRARAKQPDICQMIDTALVAIENENPTLRGKLDKRFVAADLEPGRLAELVDLISTIGFADDK